MTTKKNEGYFNKFVSANGMAYDTANPTEDTEDILIPEGEVTECIVCGEPLEKTMEVETGYCRPHFRALSRDELRKLGTGITSAEYIEGIDASKQSDTKFTPTVIALAKARVEAKIANLNRTKNEERFKAWKNTAPKPRRIPTEKIKL